MANVYLSGIEAIHNGGRDLLTGDIRCLLLTSTGPPTFDETHSFVTQIVGHANNNELTDGSYARDEGISGKSVAENGGLVEFLMAKSVFTALDNETVGAAVVYIFDTDDTDSEGLSFHDFADKAANGSNFEVRWNNVDGNGRVFTVDNS